MSKITAICIIILVFCTAYVSGMISYQSSVSYTNTRTLEVLGLLHKQIEVNEMLLERIKDLENGL